MDKKAELDFLKDHIANYDDNDLAKVLWVAYCWHHSIQVDTFEYDVTIGELWNWVKTCGYMEEIASDYEVFHEFLSDMLV